MLNITRPKLNSRLLCLIKNEWMTCKTVKNSRLIHLSYISSSDQSSKIKQEITNQPKSAKNEEPLEYKNFKSFYEQYYQRKRGKKSKEFRYLRLQDLANLIYAIAFGTSAYLIYYSLEKKKELEKRFEWLILPLFRRKLFICNGFALPENLAKDLGNFKQFPVRKEDVWIVSFPRSGTTWLQEAVYLIQNNCDFAKAKSESIELRTPLLDNSPPGLKYIDKMKSPRIIKSHLPISLLPQNIEKKCKVIYIARNPKDVAVSFYHFAKLSTEVGYDGNFEYFLEQFMNGKVPYGPWWKHVDEHTANKNIHVVHYEDLHEKPKEVIKSLAKFLHKELSDEQARSIIDWCSFENMKNNPTVNYEWYKDFGFYQKDGHFFRNGRMGDWLSYFSKNESIKLDKILSDNLKYNKEFNYGIKKEDLNKIYSHSEKT